MKSGEVRMFKEAYGRSSFCETSSNSNRFGYSNGESGTKEIVYRSSIWRGPSLVQNVMKNHGKDADLELSRLNSKTFRWFRSSSIPTFGKISNQGTIKCSPNNVPMVFVVFSRDSWGI